MKVKLFYPTRERSEELEAEETEPGFAELKQHASFIPLAPGDVVAIDQSGDIVDVVKLERTFTYEISLHLPSDLVAGRRLPDTHPSRKAIAELEEEWRREAYVTRQSNFTFMVSAPTHRWFEDRVFDHPFVHFYDRFRAPDLQLNLEVAVRHPDFDGKGGGPWA